jgi:AcrR family transcriptional regulator
MARTVTERADVLPVLGEIFREHGFEGASLSVITERTGLGKGSLYHFFPGGKEEMAAAVLEHIDTWFEDNLYRTLRDDADGRGAIRKMFRAVDAYFLSGRRVCLVGSFALSTTRDRFAARINSYFAVWIDALAGALRRAGKDRRRARELSEEVVAGIQGALVTARALDNADIFRRALKRLEARLELDGSAS